VHLGDDSRRALFECTEKPVMRVSDEGRRAPRELRARRPCRS
jgi:hypothetical protein